MRYTEGFTGKAILAMKEAIHAAEELGHTYIGSEHLLLGLMEEGGNAAASALAAQQLDADKLRHAVIDLVGRGIPAEVREDCLTPSLVSILEDAKERARDAGTGGNGASAVGNHPRPLLQCSCHSEKTGHQPEPALYALYLRQYLRRAHGAPAH